MDDALPQPRRRSLALIVSLCVNVALIAFIALVLWRGAHIDRSVGAGGPLAPKSILAEFPGRTAAIDAVIAAHREKETALRAAAVEARRALGHVVASPAYTPEAMHKAFAAIAAADAALEADAVAMSDESLAALSPGERKTLVERLKRRNRSWLWRTFHQRDRL
jgi:Spy/CpxP family protein refolding chaperone